jgi:rhodanese-related sulfurtransferase
MSEDTLNPEITAQAFAELRARAAADPGLAAPVLLDVREPWEVAMAQIPGAVLMPMGEVPSRAYTELDPDAPIVVVCAHGQRSLSVAMWLRREGFEQAQSLAGGIEEWLRTNQP